MIQNLEDWVLKHYGREVYTPGLDRISRAISSLKPILAQKKIVIIAGTNGKGETTHRLSENFKDSSFCAWTSPHIKSITERFSSQIGDIELEELKTLALKAHELVQVNDYQLTYYEFLFFAFCLWAVEKNPDYLFLEVGLGGRLDAVNALDAELVLLTSISRDHQEFLGNRFEQILKEKLGVLRPGATLMTQLETRYLQERTRSCALSLGAHYVDLNEFLTIPSFEFSRRNQFLAYAAFCHLTKSEMMPQEWKSVTTPLSSRGEIIRGKNEWWLFGSHNVDGMRKLILFLHSANYNLKDSHFDVVVTSFSKRNEKDVRIMLRMLKAANLGRVLVTAFKHPKAYPEHALKALAIHEGLEFVEDISDHVQGWTHQKILVAGSYFLLSELQPLFSVHE